MPPHRWFNLMPAIAHLPTLLSLSLIFTTSYVVANPSRLLAQHVGGQPIAMEHLSPERIDHLGQHDELEAAGYAPHFEPTEVRILLSPSPNIADFRPSPLAKTLRTKKSRR